MDGKIRKYIACALLGCLPALYCHAQQEGRQPEMMPEIPEELTEPAARAAYLVMHFWDRYDFGDPDFLRKDDLLERGFVDYADLLSLVPEEVREQSAGVLMRKADGRKETLTEVLRLCEKYLYEPDSPVYDEEKLIPLLQEALALPLPDGAAEKIRPAYLLEQALKNRTGQVAADFTYTLADGQTGTLHAAAATADRTLLYFHDPECEDCRMLTGRLKDSPLVDRLVREGKLTVLAVYTEEDTETWTEHARSFPDAWIYARDAAQQINREERYNIRRFPTVYLLDRNKKVLLKETSFEKLVACLDGRP
jgi:thiol-disulfide isomerase/thioredoxin